jgi:hypothetical protein
MTAFGLMARLFALSSFFFSGGPNLRPAFLLICI